jgi:hypothetical protein
VILNTEVDDYVVLVGKKKEVKQKKEKNRNTSLVLNGIKKIIIIFLW